MDVPLLVTKLHTPLPRPNRVSRPHLIRRLEEGLRLGRKLTLVSAPAGFGKTTLVADWLQQVNQPFTWLSLDDGDNDPVRFLAYLNAALQRINSCWGQTVREMLCSPQPPTQKAMVAALINDIAAGDSHFVLILDDYHLISTLPIHDALIFLLDNLPPQIHLVILSRADLPFSLARLRACGELTEIRADDLRFTLEEAVAFMNEVMNLGLTQQQIAALESRTEGWVAGLQLAGLSLQGLARGDVAGFIEAFAGSHRYVMDYLMEEVFSQQPVDVQRFLLQTSILDRLIGPLCDAVTGRDDGQAMLEWLDAVNLFIVPLDLERHWYRYHHLFADLLCDRLRQTQPERERELHRWAAAWYERNGFMEEAVDHALKAQDYDLAVRLIQQVAFSLWQLGKTYTLLNWMRAMPEALVRSHTSLAVDYAAALTITGQLDAVEPWLRDAEAQLLEQAANPTAALYLSNAYRLRAHVARFVGTPAEALAFSQRALEYTPADRIDMRGVTLLHMGHAHLLNGDATAADQALIEACDICRAVRHRAAYLSAAHYLAQLRIYQGRLREAQSIYQAAIEFVVEQGELVCAGIEQIGLGDLLREWNDLEAATQHIHQGLRLAEMGGDFVFLRDGYLARARLELALGNHDQALAFVHRAEQVIQHHRSSWETTVVGLWKARLYLAQGDWAGAAVWAQNCGLSSDDEPRFLDEFAHLTLAQVLLALGRLDKAGRLLERLRQAAASAGRWGRLIHILIAQALVRKAGGDMPGALQALEHALNLAEPEGYVRTFVDEGAPMIALLRDSLSQGIARSYVSRLLVAFGESAAGPFLVEPLTRRELEVIRLIADGLKNQEIADRLVISVATVKRHVTNIYGKLGVSRRIQAVAQAQELGLL